MKVVHIISNLNNGGAEGVLYRLCKSDTIQNHIVISMTGEGKYKLMLRNVGIDVYCLNMNNNRAYFKGFLKLLKLLRKLKPDIIQTWMYHADFFGGLAAKIAGIKKIFWNIRNSNLDKKSKFSTKLVLKMFILYLVK